MVRRKPRNYLGAIDAPLVMILSPKVFRSEENENITQFTLYNVIQRFRRMKIYEFETRSVSLEGCLILWRESNSINLQNDRKIFGGTSRFFHSSIELIFTSVPLLHEISPLSPAF